MPILDHYTQKTLTPKPIYPKWALIVQIVAMVIMVLSWGVEYFHPPLADIADKVEDIAWMALLLMMGHQWGFNLCLKRFRSSKLK